MAGLNAWAWREQASLKAQRAAIRGVLTSTFPGVQVVVDAPVQMAREVALLQQSSGTPTGRDVETMLALFGALAPANARPATIEFSAGELRLRGLALPAQELEPLIFKLQAQSYLATADGDSLLIKQVSAP